MIFKYSTFGRGIKPHTTSSVLERKQFDCFQNVCQVYLTFVVFDLDCQYEYFLINNQEYCGRQLLGRTSKCEKPKFGINDSKNIFSCLQFPFHI